LSYLTEESYMQFVRRRVDMFGPDTDELVRTGRIDTPYPHQITSANFPIESKPFSDLLVFLSFTRKDGVECVEDKFSALHLDPPTEEHGIRFISQFDAKNKYEVHRDKKIVFAHKPYTLRGMKPTTETYIVSVWEKKSPKLCLYHLRDSWDSGFIFVGVATHLRKTKRIPNLQLTLTA